MTEITSGATLTEWRNGLIDVDPKLAGALTESSDPYAVLNELGLPVPGYIGFDRASDFMEEPAENLSQLAARGVTNYYVGLRTKVPGWSKYRTPAPISRDEVVPYICENVPPERRDRYALRVAEYIVADLGVVTIINPPEVSPYGLQPGRVHMDIRHGDLGPLATGLVTPEIQANTDDRGILRYRSGRSGENKEELTVEEREALWKALQSIPTEFSDGDMRTQKLPGYYEFALVRHNQRLDALFVDAKPSNKGNRVFTLR